MPFEWVKSLAALLDALGKGWRLTLPGAVAAGLILYASESAFPYVGPARSNYGVWLLVVFLFCSLHFGVYAIEGVGRVAFDGGRKLVRALLERRRLIRLTPSQKRMLAPVVLNKRGPISADATDPDARSLMRLGILRLSPGASHSVGRVNFYVVYWAAERLKNNPAFLDVAE